MLINFCGSFDPRNVFNGRRLHNGRVPGAFLVSGLLPEPTIAGCNAVAFRSSRRLDIYLGRCGRSRTLIFVDHCCVNVFIHVLNFRGWSQPRNYFNSEIFPIYGMLSVT